MKAKKNSCVETVRAPMMLEGREAFSDFRLRALFSEVSETIKSRKIDSVSARYVYFLECVGGQAPATETDRARLLLGATTAFEHERGFFVTPRRGTISPWSSKATDIFRNCGLTSFARVERGIHYVVEGGGTVLGPDILQPVLHLLHDRMTEGVYTDVSDLFRHMDPGPLVEIDVMGQGRDALDRANREMGLALSGEEIGYLHRIFTGLKRNPTDVELVMFGQVNSEHCRHKIFNAGWKIDGRDTDMSLFSMIKHTHEKNGQGTLVAYRDNAAVVDGFQAEWFRASRDGEEAEYGYEPDQIDIIMKVETHNHPTAISPYPGAATGVGGEIRDESATGTGGKSKGGLAAFMVSNLRVPGFSMPWEKDHAEFPSHLATPFEIMIQGPIGGAGFGNEFGRPQLCGLFRTYEDRHGGRYRGYHKPIMAAGGMGNIRRRHISKRDLPVRAAVVQLGGPAMKIGLGGGAASSLASGNNAAELDYNSVQRGNAEMERRCQEVIDACIALGDRNPILSIHDIGAGGLSNGCPELVADTGATFRLREVPNEDLSMSPMEIWCCEAQERYVLAVVSERVDEFLRLCVRERCPAAVIGSVTGDRHLLLEDSHFGNTPIDADIGVFLGKPPRMTRDVAHAPPPVKPLDLSGVKVREAFERVLRLPSVANKTFLITIADRSVTGMVARDQMVGPFQVPVADAAVTTTGYESVTGEAMAMGERTPVALISGPASGRMAIGEALTNIASVCVGQIGNVKLSANWMCACGQEGEDAALFDTVRAVGMDLCPALGISIPVGKDSLSMCTVWRTSGGTPEKMTAPLSLIVSAFAPVYDVTKTVTPDLKQGESVLVLLDLGGGKNRMGGSALAQVYNQVGDAAPDMDDPAQFKGFFRAVQEMVRDGLIMAYHDRSDGGLAATILEMAFAGRVGVKVHLDTVGNDVLGVLFSEELGAVLQVAEGRLQEVRDVLARHGVADIAKVIGTTVPSHAVEFLMKDEIVFKERLSPLLRMWSELTYRMQAARDNPKCALEEYDALLEEDDPGMTFDVKFDPNEVPSAPKGVRPKTAILREQGVNGHVEMAAAFDRAGFRSVDVHMTDLISGRVSLEDFSGLVACGGFSYGDVLGAGSGWAKSILFNERLREMFSVFFHRRDTFALGVCNGCQMMAQLREIIPGADHWPLFTRNRSEQFEARYVTVEVMETQSMFFRGMAGSRLGIAVAHGEGFADFSGAGSREGLERGGLVAVRYVDGRGRPTERYPLNPNGSAGGITGVTTVDGRVTILMPHPERGFRSVQMSWRPGNMFTGEAGPWMRMFRNARAFVG